MIPSTPSSLQSTTEAMEDEGDSTTALIWGLASVTVVSLASLAGGALIPLVTGESRRRWMHFFIAMAVGTLSSDAILHLIPGVLGIHTHSHGGHHHHNHSAIVGNSTPLPMTSPLPGVTLGEDHDHSHHDHDHDHDHHRMKRHGDHEHHHHEHNSTSAEEVDDHAAGIAQYRTTLLKLSCLLAAIYVLYLFEFIAYYRGGGHGHSHHSRIGDRSPAGTEKSLVVWDAESGLAAASASSSVESTVPVSPLAAQPALFCGLKGPAVIILFGDGVHNFVDGLAMGASFATSIPIGIATTIAVFCHELPHELGDLAVLLETGLSMSVALGLNLLSALTAFIGLLIGLYASQMETATNWLLAITAGMFLYLAWIDMLSHLKHEAAESDDSWWITCLLQFAGFAVGTAPMFVLAWFEDEWFAHH